MSTVYQFTIPYEGQDTDTDVSNWFRSIGCNHWFIDYKTTPPEDWPKHLGVNPPRRLYTRSMIVGIMDDHIALQFKLAFSATELAEPFLRW